jgi:hypothetical protein
MTTSATAWYPQNFTVLERLTNDLPKTDLLADLRHQPPWPTAERSGHESFFRGPSVL